MGYKLADGSDSEQYKIGDEFEVLSGCYIGSTVKISQIMGNDPNPFFLFLDNNMRRIPWVDLKPRPTSGNDKTFAKSDLKDGDKIYIEEGVETRCGDKVDPNEPLYVCGNNAYQIELPDILAHIKLHLLNDNLETPKGAKVVKVIRDGTVVFEREPEKKKVTLELTDEQIESPKQQGIFKEK